VATLTRVTLVPVGSTFTGVPCGQAAGYQAASGGGDLIPISSGRGTIIRFKTTGTGSTITLDSVVATAYGTDVNPQLTMAATDEQEVFIPNDGGNRFDQQPTNPQLLAVTYSSVVGLSVAAKTVP
jgi:hypothetical protein